MDVNSPSFSNKVLKGFLWIGTGTLLGQLISWIATIIIIRLLSPSDYGLLAMAGTFTALLTMISELGMGSSIIQAPKISENEIQKIFGIVIVTNVLAWAICHLAAPAIALFYNERQLVSIIRVMNINFILMAFYIIPQSLFIREMNFKTKTKIDVSAQVGSAFLTLILALNGIGVWSLVTGIITLHLIKIIGFNIARSPWLNPIFKIKGSENIIKFGLNVTGSRLFYYLFRQSDGIIIGRLLGNKLLGIYSVALQLASIPGEKVLPVINQISFTSYSRIQDDIHRIKRNFLRATRAIAVLSFPLFFGMAGTAPEAIPLILGQKWKVIIIPFQLLCLSLPLQIFNPNLSRAVLAIGKPTVNLINMAIISSVMTVAFLIGIQYGIIGICLAWVITYPVVFFITCLHCLHALNIPLINFLSEIKIPLLVSSLMLFLIITAKNTITVIDPITFLVLSAIFGFIFYFGIIFIVKKEDYMELKDLIMKK